VCSLVNNGLIFYFKRNILLLDLLLISLDCVLGVLDFHFHISLLDLLLMKLLSQIVVHGFVLVQILDQINFLRLKFEDIVLHSLSVILG